MHAKHRNGLGNGYRSNVMGMGGVASASRIPPETPMRGQRIYSTDYRNYSRGGYASGGHSKQFQQPAPPSRGADVFMEAGRLAAEYLVSKGVLPPNALTGMWQNDSFKNFATSQGFGPHEVETAGDGRGSSHSRLGNASLNVGPGRRRYSDDYNLISSRSSAKERKRTVSLKNYGSEMNRESGRGGSLAEKINALRGMDADSDAEITQEADSEVRVESGLEKSKLEDVNANDGTPSNDRCLQPDDADGERTRTCDDGNNFKNEAEVVKEGENDGLQQKHGENKVVTGSVREDSLVGETEGHVDLVRHSKFVNVPTRSRSSLTIKISKVGQGPMNNDENIYGRELPEGSGVHVIDVDTDNSADKASFHRNPEFKSHESDVPNVEKELDVTNTTRSVHKEPEGDEGLSVFGRSNSLLMERGEKRASDFNTDVKEDVKRLRQWVPVLDTQSDGLPTLSRSIENHLLLQAPRTSLNAYSTQSPDQKSVDMSLIVPKDQADSCEFIEEKQLFPGSFKTCDLNLVGNGDASENCGAGHRLVFPSVVQTGKSATPIDVDFSISNDVNLPDKNGKHVNGNEIEVIDLERDSAPEDKTFSNPDRRRDTVFMDLDGFPNNAHNANGITDVQDGYGLLISEFLGHDSPNCSVSADLNSLHNHMDLPNTEGILGDDDSIYMSLGEIPISLLGPWEQPTQDYGKPF